MTEDDTFNALKRSPFEIVYNELKQNTAGPHDHLTIEPILAKHGWTMNEFFIKYKTLNPT